MYHVIVLNIQMTSVERILSYTNLDQEPASFTEHRPSEDWPEAGNIHFNNVSLYYYEGAPAALQSISATIKSEEKVGCFQEFSNG